MFSDNMFLRVLALIMMVIVMLSIIAFVLWKWAVFLRINYNFKTIIMISLWVLGAMIASMMISSSSFPFADYIGTIISYIMYTLWFLAPLLIVLSVVGLWYKFPPALFIISCLTWLGVGLYLWTQTKTTDLVMTDTWLDKEYKIIFISDLHVDNIRSTRYITSIVKKLEQQQPDMVLIGGDLLNRAKNEYAKAFLSFNTLSMPIYAVLWNHDHMWDSQAAQAIFDTTKIIPLVNESVLLSGLQIVGIEDKNSRHGKTLDNLLIQSNINTGADYTIFLTHQPQKLSKLKDYPINLQLAGHTHRWQFVPLSWIVWWFNDYAYGRYDKDDKTAFVSQGLGLWWAPLRMGTQSEMVIITLKP